MQALAYGDLLLYRDCVEELYALVSFKIKKDDKKAIQEDFAKASSYIAWQTPEGDVLARAIIRQIDLDVTKQMDKSGMLSPKYKWVEGFDNQRDKYGLPKDE